MPDAQQTWTISKWLYENGGLLAVLVTILWGNWRGVWCWGKEKAEADTRWKARYDEVCADRDWWRAGCLRGWNVAGTAVDKLEKSTPAKVDVT